MRISGVVVAILLFVGILEIAGGFVSGSLALFSDVGHVFVDVTAQGVIFFGQWNPFRWKRLEPKAALTNGVLLVGVGLSFGFLGWQRLGEPKEVQPILMTVFAFFGLGGNAVVVWLRGKGSRENISIWSGRLHAISDALASLGLFVGGGYIILTQQFVVDAALTVGIAVLILLGAAKIITDAWHMLWCSGECAKPHRFAHLDHRA